MLKNVENRQFILFFPSFDSRRGVSSSAHSSIDMQGGYLSDNRADNGFAGGGAGGMGSRPAMVNGYLSQRNVR